MARSLSHCSDYWGDSKLMARGVSGGPGKLSHALAFSSDGQFVAAATGNRSLCVWSVAQGKLFTVLRPPVRR